MEWANHRVCWSGFPGKKDTRGRNNDRRTLVEHYVRYILEALSEFRFSRFGDHSHTHSLPNKKVMFKKIFFFKIQHTILHTAISKLVSTYPRRQSRRHATSCPSSKLFSRFWLRGKHFSFWEDVWWTKNISLQKKKGKRVTRCVNNGCPALYDYIYTYI